MNILIIDDDRNFSLKLKNDFINEFKSVENIITVEIVNRDFSNIDIDDLDIAFLDIDLETDNGIAVGAKLRKKFPNLILIYVSAKEELVFQSLSTGVYQFIRKSKYMYDKNITFNQLKHTILNKQIRFININKRSVGLQLSKIRFIHSYGKELTIEEKQKYTFRSSIKDILRELDYPFLVQIQRNTVVNCNYIAKIQKNIVYTKDGDEYTLGKKYVERLNAMYEEYLLQ